MPLLGLEVPKAEVDKLFDSWSQGDGSLSLSELNKILRRGGEIRLDGALEPGAAGEIVMESKAKIALRKGGPSQRGTALRKIDLDEAKPIQEQLRNAITEQAVRVIELFREWDENGDGQVSKKEFRKAMPLLGLEVPTVEVDKLFDASRSSTASIPTRAARSRWARSRR